MTITMDRKKFDSLKIEAVGHACFEPIVPVYQKAMCEQGGLKPEEVRTKFYQTLSLGQRALFMFFSYYDHAIQSKDEFKRISHSYLSSHIFGAVKKGVEFFHDTDMLNLLLMIEQTLSGEGQSKDMALYSQLKEISPHTLITIGTYIKENPADFICFE